MPAVLSQQKAGAAAALLCLTVVPQERQICCSEAMVCWLFLLLKYILGAAQQMAHGHLPLCQLPLLVSACPV